MTEDVGTTARGSLSGKRKLAIWERERGCCMECGVKLMTGQFIYEHVRALKDHKMAAKAKRVKQNHLGLKQSRTPMPYGKMSKWKKKLDGSIVPR